MESSPPPFPQRAPNDLRRLFLVALAVATAGAVAQLALVLRLTYATDSGWIVAGLWLAGTLPAVALSPWIGLLIDRVETVLVLRLMAILEAVLDLGLAVLPGVGSVLLLAIGLGLTVSLSTAGLYAVVSTVPDPERRSRRAGPLSLIQAAAWAGATVGPIVGAALVSALRTRLPLVLDAAVLTGCALALGGLRTRRRPNRIAAGPDSPWNGLSLLGRDPHLRGILGPVAMVIVAVNLGVVVDVFLATRVLMAGSIGYGALVTAWGAGMVGGTLLPQRVTGWSHQSLIGVGGILAGLGLAGAGISPDIGLAVSAYVLGGLGNGLEANAARLLVQSRAEPGGAGRAFAAYFAFGSSAAAAGTVVGGLVLQPLGARQALGLGALLSVSGGLALLFLARIARRSTV